MSLSSTSVYNDFQGLAALKYQARQDQSGSLDKVAKQFESLFMQMMVKQMRQASFGGGIFDSDRTRQYQEMYDQQLSIHLSESGGMGISDVLKRQLGDQQSSQTQALSGLEPYWSQPVRRSFSGTEIKPAEPSDTHQEVRATKPSTAETGNPDDFVANLWPAAESAAAEIGLAPEALLAQAALETGWGRHVMSRANGESSHNLFGIKADQRWDGQAARHETLEYESGLAVKRREYFRAYDSYEASFRDYVDFIRQSPRYADALSKSHDSEAYFVALQEAGYATDPAYAEKIHRVMRGPEMQAAMEQIKNGGERTI
jgi:flagellar protein FlgJ